MYSKKTKSNNKAKNAQLSFTNIVKMKIKSSIQAINYISSLKPSEIIALAQNHSGHKISDLHFCKPTKQQLKKEMQERIQAQVDKKIFKLIPNSK